MKKYAQDTICIQGGYEPKNGEPRILPIFQSTTYKYDEADEVAKLFDLEAAGHMYSRISNPTVEALEKKIAFRTGGKPYSHPDYMQRRRACTGDVEPVRWNIHSFHFDSQKDGHRGYLRRSQS